MPRNFTMIEVFGIAFSIMGLMPSIASTLAYSIPAGPVGMVWGWFLASMFIFFVGLAMADLGSAMPTSGGLYWFVCIELRALNTLADVSGGRTTSPRQQRATPSHFSWDTATHLVWSAASAPSTTASPSCF